MPLCGDQDKEPNHLMAEYEQLCPGGLDEGAVKEDNEVCATEQPAESAVDTTAEATDATAAEDQEKKEEAMAERLLEVHVKTKGQTMER